MSKMALRIALRIEGTWWVAYVAEPGTMEGALELARIRMSMVGGPDRKQRFMQLVQDAVAEVITSTTGSVPEMFETRPAPEHERAGRA